MSFDLEEIIVSMDKQDEVLFGGTEKTKPKKIESDKVADHFNIENYTEVPRTLWTQLQKDTYVRYIDKNGKIRAGGKIKSFTSVDGDTFMTLGKYNVATKKFYIWKVRFNDMSKLYRFNIDKNTTEAPQNTINTSTPAIQSSKPDDNFMHQLGNKLLFEEGDLLKQEIESVKKDIKRIDENVLVLFGMMKKIYKKLGMLKKPLDMRYE